jgi:hypothetical protein
MIVMMTATPKTTFETILAVVLPVEGYIVKLEAKYNQHGQRTVVLILGRPAYVHRDNCFRDGKDRCRQKYTKGNPDGSEYRS